MATRAELAPLIRREWMKRPRAERTEDHVIAFYGYLEQQRLDLLDFDYPGDKYQALHSILGRLVEKRGP